MQAVQAEKELAWDRLSKGLFSDLLSLAADIDLPRIVIKQKTARQFSLLIMMKTLRQVFATSAGGRFDPLSSKEVFKGKYARMISSWIFWLEKFGILQGQLWNPHFAGESIIESARARLLNAWGADDPLAHYLMRCEAMLSDVLLEKESAVEMFFPGGDFDTADALYRSSDAARFFNGIVTCCIRRILELQASVRVFEIGAGTGGLTSAILPVIADGCAEYFFTDTTRFFFPRAKQGFSNYPFFRVGVVDIERELPSDFSRGEFDVVIASNALHATRDIEAALGNAVQAMKPGGFLLLNEETRNEPWFDVTSGPLHGWHRFEDGWRQAGGPLIAPETWLELLRKFGMTRMMSLPEAANPASILGQNIFLARL